MSYNDGPTLTIRGRRPTDRPSTRTIAILALAMLVIFAVAFYAVVEPAWDRINGPECSRATRETPLTVQYGEGWSALAGRAGYPDGVDPVRVGDIIADIPANRDQAERGLLAGDEIFVPVSCEQ